MKKILFVLVLLMISFGLVGCISEEERQLFKEIKADIEKTWLGEIKNMFFHGNKKQFGQWNGVVSYSNPSEVSQKYYVMIIRFFENQKEQTF